MEFRVFLAAMKLIVITSHLNKKIFGLIGLLIGWFDSETVDRVKCDEGMLSTTAYGISKYKQISFMYEIFGTVYAQLNSDA